METRSNALRRLRGFRRLAPAEWREREERHAARLRPWTEPHLRRRSLGETHPVYDFLFDYYSHPVAKLLRWSPGADALLTGEGSAKFLSQPGYRADPEGALFDGAAFPEGRRESLRWALDFLKATAGRPAQFSCHGLHEWAMVYRSPEVRHGRVPLRLAPEALAVFVEGQTLCCSHYDAFRFFTPEARPLNRLIPEKHRQTELDQPGCLHVNMDLYKWAYKFSPWISGELTADCFELAAAAREIDMRASPYDLSDLSGLEWSPIAIETEAGREHYAQCQRDLAERGRPLRERLIAEMEAIASV